MELADNLTGAIAGVVTVSDDDLTRNDGCIVARTLHGKPPAPMGEVIDVLSVVRREIVVVNDIDIGVPALGQVAPFLQTDDFS